VTLTDYY